VLGDVFFLGGGEGGGLGEVVWGFRVALYGVVFWLVFFNPVLEI